MRLEDIIRGIPKTELIYWRDSYTKMFDANILRTDIEKSNAYLVLDKTAFHPKSGGQPTDTGVIQNSDFNQKVKKTMVFRGVVIHWGKFEGKPSEDKAFGEIDWEKRYLYMKRHTGGHLLDHCLTIVTGVPVKTTDAWHGDECYVGYQGDPPKTEIVNKAVDIANRHINNGAQVKIEFISHDELLKRSPSAPNIYRLPHLKTYRIVTIEGCKPIPCGGTHVKDIKEITCFDLNEVKENKLGYRVYYDVQ
jgi:Ser-tRNA(Ala) deacylase AlaX